MNTREISARLHDILATACRVRQPGTGRSADAALVGIDEVKAGLRDLIREVGDAATPPPAPRVRATAGAFPQGQVAGTRTTVEHRRSSRGAALPRRSAPSPLRRAAEAEFASLTGRTAGL